MNGRKFASVAGTVTVAGIAAYASYLHMRELALHAGQPVSIANVLPLSVDGLVLVASVALVDGRERRKSAWAAFVLGVSASIIANILAAGPSLTDRAVSAWPSVALLVTIEVIARGGKRRNLPLDPGEALPAKPPADLRDLPATWQESARSRRPSRKAPPSTTAAARVAKAAAKLPAGTPAEIAALAKVSESTARRHLASTNTPAPAQMNGHDVLAEATK